MSTTAITPTGQLITVTAEAYKQALATKVYDDKKVVFVKRMRSESADEAARRGAALSPGVFVIVQADDEEMVEPEVKDESPDLPVPKMKEVVDDFIADVHANQTKPLRTLMPGKGFQYMIPFKAGFDTDDGMFELHVLPTTGKTVFMMKPEYRIEAFHTMTEFHERFVRLVTRIAKRFMFIRTEPDSKISDVFGTKPPVRNAIGFDLYDAWSRSLNKDEQIEYWEMYKSLNMGRTPPKDELKIDTPAVLPPPAVHLISLASSILEERMAPWKQAYDVLRYFETALHVRDVPMELHEDQLWLRVMAPPLKPGMYQRLMLENPLLRKYEAERMHEIFRSMVVVDPINASTTYADLAAKLEINLTRASSANAMPAQLTKTNGVEFFRSMFVAMSAATIVRLNVPISWTTQPTMVEFIQLILLKLVLPSYTLSPQSRIDIDNKILWYLEHYVRYTAAAGAQAIFSMDTAINGSYNMLHDACNANPWGFSARAREFLRTRSDAAGLGGGWSTTAQYATQRQPPIVEAFTGVGGPAFSVFSSDFNDMPQAVNQPGQQFKLFAEFVREANRVAASSKSKDFTNAALVLRIVAESEVTFSNMAATITELNRQVTRLGLFPAVEPRDEPGFISDRLVIDVMPEAFAAIMLIPWPTVRLGTPDAWSVVDYARSRDHWAQDLANANWFVSTHYPTSHFSRSERYRLMRDAMTIDLGFNNEIFDKVIIGRPAAYFFRFPPLSDANPKYVEYITAITTMIRQAPELFGYAPSFVYNGKQAGAAESNGRLRYFMTSQGDASLETPVTVADLSNLRAEGDFVKMFREAKEAGRSIRINHPIWIQMVETKSIPDQPSPLDPHTTDADYPIGTLYWYYTWDDTFRDDEGPINFNRRNPDFVIDRAPMRFDGAEFISSCMVRVKTYRQGFRIADRFGFKPRVTFWNP